MTLLKLLCLCASFQQPAAVDQLTPSWFGSAAGFAGRVDEDEHVDLIVFEGNYREANRAWVLSGESRRVLHRFAGVEGIVHLVGVHRAGDVDGDGRDDLLVGWRPWSSNWYASDTDWEVRSGASGKRIRCFTAASVSRTPDFDGDGTGDFLVRSFDWQEGVEDLGSHRLVSGRSGELLREYRASSAEGALGSSSKVVGDVDGDGVPEIAGTRRLRSGGWELVVMSVRGTKPVLRLQLTSSSHACFSVCDAGDHDGDGRDDLGVGRTFSSSPRPEREGFRILSGVDGTVLLEVTDAAVGVDPSMEDDFWDTDFGSGVARLGDLDGDSVSDFLVGAESYRLGTGAFVLISGAHGEVLAIETAPLDVHGCVHFASGFDAGEDWDGDGTPDWLVTSGSLTGGPGIGAVCIYSGSTRSLLECITRDALRE